MTDERSRLPYEDVVRCVHERLRKRVAVTIATGSGPPIGFLCGVIRRLSRVRFEEWRVASASDYGSLRAVLAANAAQLGEVTGCEEVQATLACGSGDAHTQNSIDLQEIMLSLPVRHVMMRIERPLGDAAECAGWHPCASCERGQLVTAG